MQHCPATLRVWRCLPALRCFRARSGGPSSFPKWVLTSQVYNSTLHAMHLIIPSLQVSLCQTSFATRNRRHTTICQQAPARIDFTGPGSEAKLIYAVSAGSQHDMPGHPECAARIPAIMSALQKANMTSAARPDQVRQCRPTSRWYVCVVV